MQCADLLPPVSMFPVPCRSDHACKVAELDRDEAKYDIEGLNRILPHEVEDRLGGEISEDRDDQVGVAQVHANDGANGQQDRQQNHRLPPEQSRGMSPVGDPRYRGPLAKVQGKSAGGQQTRTAR
jgi:hypothetical protein